MHAQSYANTPGYLVIVIGLVLSLVSALAPHFEAGYQLMFSVFIAGMLPYMVYAIAVPMLRGTLTTIVGVVIVIAHAWLVYSERIVGNADYSNGLIYYGPMIIALAVLPLALIAFNRSQKF